MLWKRRLPLQEGQGLVEYVLILSLVSIAVLIALTLFGEQLKTVYEDILLELGGCTAVADDPSLRITAWWLVEGGDDASGANRRARITNNGTYDISSYNQSIMNVEAVSSPGEGSVVFAITTQGGKNRTNHIQKGFPYEVHAGTGASLGTGKVSVRATPYTGTNGDGDKGCLSTISFNVKTT